MHLTTPNFSTGLRLTRKYRRRPSRTSPTLTMPSNSTTRVIPPESPSSQISVKQTNRRNKVSFFLWAAACSLSAAQLSVFSEFEQKQRFGNGRQDCQINPLQSPGLLERHRCYHKIRDGTKVPEETTKQCLIKQVWRIHLLELRYIPDPNSVYRRLTWSDLFVPVCQRVHPDVGLHPPLFCSNSRTRWTFFRCIHVSSIAAGSGNGLHTFLCPPA